MAWTSLMGLLLSMAVLAAAFTSCAGHGECLPRRAYVVESGAALLENYAPVFVVERWSEQYNRIGAPTARLRDGEEEIHVDPARPVVYGDVRRFGTELGNYTNLVYRVHFQKVPFPHVTWGPNVGLLAVITLDQQHRPVLLTTVHTCGCYLAFIPTSYLPQDALPPGRGSGQQEVFGETLPGRLPYPEQFLSVYRPVISLRSGTHRVMDVDIQNVAEAEWRYDVIPAALEPLEALERLPLDGGVTSLFHQQGRRMGYVKGSHKPLERLLISWWALDAYVGRDKKLAPPSDLARPFYTSLKPWSRRESEMYDFASFLDFWGWQL